VVVGIVAWLALDNMERDVRREVGHSLKTLLDTSHGSLVVWTGRHLTEVEAIAQGDSVVDATRRLLTLPRDRDALIASSSMTQLRDLFGQILVRDEHLGFFIIAPDGTNVASTLDADVGTENLIFTRRPEEFERAIAGEAVLVPPSSWDVPSTAPDEHANAPVMFVAAPVVDERGTTLAVLAQSLDPFRDFSRLLELARLGASGETYAFDQDGRLLSNIRFDDELRAVGLLEEGSLAVLTLRIADPGGDLLTGYQPPEEVAGWPLTKAVAEATRRRAGHDVEGYRDYRGVPVIGAWTWSDELGIGLASELAVEDALTPYYSTRRWVLGLVAGIALLALFLTWLVFWVRSRGVRALADRENRLRSILETAVDGIVTIDGRGTIETINPAVEAMFGFTQAEAVGKNVSMLIPHASEDIEQYLKTGEAEIVGIGGELVGKRKDGTFFPLELGLAEIPADDGGGLRFTGVIRDITERKSLQAQFLQSQKMEAVGHLAAGVAHDFNNLLMSVSGTARIALGRLDDRARVQKLLEEIQSTSVAGAAITRQLLWLARTKDAEPMEIELDQAVGQSRVMLDRLLGEDIDLRMELGAPSAWLSIEEGHIDQILINLAVNARDAMPQGGMLLITTSERNLSEEEVGPEGTPGPHLTLTVEDTGVGMDQETLSHVFEPFFTTKDAGEGTGLGLSTVCGIVVQSGGAIDVESDPGAGTKFTIHLPRIEAPATRPSSQRPEHEPPIPPMAILVVEDEELVRASVDHFLRAAGHEVATASGIEEAKAACAADGAAIDVLITDVVLRDASGAAVAELVRQRHPEAAVLFMSAHPPEYLWKTGRLPEGTKTLQKPFDADTLNRRLRELVETMSPAPRDTPPTILLVEDDRVTRDATTELLEDEGFRVHAAGNGAEAERIYQEVGGPVIVITDIGLPDVSGQALVERLEVFHVVERVIYLSGRSADDPAVKHALAKPQASFLQKPIDFDELTRHIRRAPPPETGRDQ
jgi:PAS domain S-box-containing protein